MPRVTASPKEVRRARAFLQARHARAMISPRKFADAAKEGNIGFSELFAQIARLYMGGQFQAHFRREQIEKIAAAGGT